MISAPLSPRCVAAFSFWALIGLSAVAAAAESAPPDRQSVTYLDISFPAVLGDAKRVSASQRSENDAGRGFETVYAHDRTTTTIQIDPPAQGRVTDGDPRGSILTREFNNQKHSVLLTRSGGADVKAGAEFTILDSSKKPRLVCAPFVISPGRLHGSKSDDPWDYFVCIGAANGYFLKTSTRFWHRPTAEATVRGFLGVLVNHVWKQLGTNP